MEKNSKSVIVVSVLAVLTIVINLYITPEAYASNVYNANLVGSGSQMQTAFFDSGSNATGLYYFVPRGSASAVSQQINFVSSDSGKTNPVVGHITIKPMIGGCAIYSSCSSTTGGGDCYTASEGCAQTSDTHWKVTIKGLWCGLSECYTQLQSQNSSYPSQLIRFSPVNGSAVFNTVDGYMNISQTRTLSPVIWGVELSSGGIGGISVFTARVDTGDSNNYHVYKTGGTTIMSDVANLNTQSVLSPSAISGCWHCGGNLSRSVIDVTWKSTTADICDQFLRADTMAQINIYTCTTLGVSKANSGGTAFYKGYSNGTVQFLSTSDTSTILTKITPSNVVSRTSASYATSGFSNYATGIVADSNSSSYYVMDTNQIIKLNFTNFGVQSNFDSVQGSVITGYLGTPTTPTGMALDTRAHTLISADDTSKAEIIYLSNFATSSGSSGGSGGNSVNGKCGVGTALDCVGNRGTLNAITGAPALTTTVTNLGNGLGVFNSTNTDPKTNGSGLFLMVGTGVFFITAIVSTIAVANSRFNAGIGYADVLTKEVWLFLVVGIISLSFYLGWIPDIVFYGMVVGLAGLFTFGIYRHIKGGE